MRRLIIQLKLFLIISSILSPVMSLGNHDSGEKVSFSEGMKYMRSVSPPVVALDGKSFYVDINSYVPSEGRTGSSRIVRFDLDGGELKNNLPIVPLNMSPDGQWIAAMESRQGKFGLWAYNVVSKEYRFFANIYQSNHFLGHTANKNILWSPDGKYIAYVAGEREPEKQDSDVRVYSRIGYKTRTSLSDNIRTHIFIIKVKEGVPRQLTNGPNDDHSLTWSPDGSKIAFISNRTQDPDNNYNNDIWIVEIATGKVTRVTDTPGTEFSPLWSPDGKYLAYLAGVRPINTTDSQAENPRLFVLLAHGDIPSELGRNLDLKILEIRWSPDSRHIYFTAENQGSILLYRISIDGKEINNLVSGKVIVESFDFSATKKCIVYKLLSDEDPGEIWAATLDGKEHRQLTHFQDTFKNKVIISKPEMFWFESFDGTPVQGWLIKPKPFDETRKYPVILRIHGGPHYAFYYQIYDVFQRLAEAGFGLILINPRGSSGYGQKFSDGTINEWGGAPYKDIMAGVNYAIANNDWIDADRLGVAGESYGGYMTNWAITQTDRFKAAASIYGVSNLVSFYGTSLYQLLIETEFPGNIWDNFDLLWHWSPLKHVRNVKTPTIFFHGENDNDVPISQSEEMFIALKKMGVDSLFVRIANEKHGSWRPDHRLEYIKRQENWFSKYLHPEKIVYKRTNA